MSKELRGNQYTYIVDNHYGINQDGFIAIGTESIVYKGLKIKQGSDLQFSCVLKFKPRRVLENGRIVDRLKVFKEQEWKIFEKLRECRSIVKIDDVIEDLGSFSLTCPYGRNQVEITDDRFFCVVEEFIDGWNLKQYCEEEYWKLSKVREIQNGLRYYVKYRDYSDEEKKEVQDSYNYDNILKYQSQILRFMQNLCEILQFVSEKELVLHLDLKPDNIMVTRYGKELVLIDFGRSRTTTLANRTVQNELPPVDYRQAFESLQAQFQHGTQGYAAPECYCAPAAGSEFPFHGGFRMGEMSIESDIFSFGATFWECLNVFRLCTETRTYAEDPRLFYLTHFMQDRVYFARDLSLSSPHYQKKLEEIIRKCTKARTEGYRSPDNPEYYHSYTDIKKDVEEAMDSAPTIVREENVRVKRAFRLGGALLGAFVVVLGIYLLYKNSAHRVALEKWDAITAEYNDTQFYRLEDVARELIDSADAREASDDYEKIARFTYEGNDVSEYDAALLVELLQSNSSIGRLPERVDEIVKNANAKKLKEISIEIVKLGDVPNSTGYRLAKAICDIEVAGSGKDKTQLQLDAYDTLMELKDNRDFHNAVLKLKNVLNGDRYIDAIAEAKGQDPTVIKASLEAIS